MSDLFDPTQTAGPLAARHKIFFALRPDPVSANRIFRSTERLRRLRGLSGWPTRAERLHISLNGLGAYEAPPAQLIAAAAAGMDGLTWPSFGVALDRLGTW